MNSPGILLSFDDAAFIADWIARRDRFLANNVIATFYVSLSVGLTAKDWTALLELQSDGHTIGYHGFNHLRAGAWDKPRVGKTVNDPVFENWQDFLDKEIHAGLSLMQEHGFRPEHYAYPWGNHTDFTDRELLKVFKSLRTGNGMLFGLATFPRVFGARNFGKWPHRALSGHESLAMASQNCIAPLFMHQPIDHRLEWLVDVAKARFLDLNAVEFAE